MYLFIYCVIFHDLSFVGFQTHKVNKIKCAVEYKVKDETNDATTSFAVDETSDSVNCEQPSFTETVGFGVLMGVLGSAIAVGVTSGILYKSGIFKTGFVIFFLIFIYQKPQKKRTKN